MIKAVRCTFMEQVREFGIYKGERKKLWKEKFRMEWNFGKLFFYIKLLAIS